jgi:UDP-N-acetylmuramoyl-L-alanyl-D-glutamate--2,6-diaminopimelate ligase
MEIGGSAADSQRKGRGFMRLKELLEGITVLSATADMELEIPDVSYDSRTVRPGGLFVAMTGFAVDGHDFIGKAMEAGAAAVLCQRVPEGNVPYIQTADSRRALAVVGANFFGHPAEDMTMAGITGTNGKTSSTYLLKAILEQAAGAKVGLIGTNQNMVGQEIIPTERTTPESFELQRLFAQMRDAGCTHVVMEVSSHALALDRVYGVRYQVGVFTNLTQDHLDFHGTMEEYCGAKALLFRNCGTGVVNADDPWTPRLTAEASCEIFTYAEAAEADHSAGTVAVTWEPSEELPGYVLAQGILPLTPDDKSPVLLETDRGWYEACLLEGNGFGLYLPEDAAIHSIAVWSGGRTSSLAVSDG